MQARNEELARKVAKVSEDDMAAAQADFEARCATAERKVRSAAASTRHLLCGMDFQGRPADAGRLIVMMGDS